MYNFLNVKGISVCLSVSLASGYNWSGSFKPLLYIVNVYGATQWH